MNTAVLTDRDKNHRFPAEIISHALWWFVCFRFSYRAVEEPSCSRAASL